ncbi:MAG TPA: cyclic nucleotide-binding domain-containing protein, partial [Burkholderiales bacterium]|nr:cyclic nucleotide-binding domain-containing protein [Burkholderiales bacterium]
MEEALVQARRSNRRETWDEHLIQGVLKGTKLLRGAAAAQLATLAAQCWSREFRRGETILSKEARLPGVFAVAVGTVKLSLRRLPGEERVVRLVQPGQTFGEASALLNRPARIEA